MGDKNEDTAFLQLVSEFIGRTQEAIHALKTDIRDIKRIDEKSAERLWNRVVELDKGLGVLVATVTGLSSSADRLAQDVRDLRAEVGTEITVLHERVSKTSEKLTAVGDKVTHILYWTAGAAAALTLVLYLISTFWK